MLYRYAKHASSFLNHFSTTLFDLTESQEILIENSSKILYAMKGFPSPLPLPLH